MHATEGARTATDSAAALAGGQRTLCTAALGRLAWYQDAPAHGTTARPLLLLHSINAAGSAYEVKPLYEHYRRERAVYALDLPGFGRSERSPRRYTPRLMTDAIHAMVAQIAAEHPGAGLDAIALSLSAEFLARAAVEAPLAFRSLALISPTGFNRIPLREGPAGSTLGRAGAYRLISRPWLGRRLYGLLTRRGVIRYFLRRTWGARAIDEGMLDYDCDITRIAGAEHAPLEFLSGYLFSGDSGTVYRQLRLPVWVVHGVRGDFTKYPGLALLEKLPNWRVEVLPTGALPHFEMTAEFIRRYEAWRRGLPEDTVSGS